MPNTMITLDDLLCVAGRVKTLLLAMDDVINSERDRVEQDTMLLDLIDIAVESVQTVQQMGGHLKRHEAGSAEE